MKRFSQFLTILIACMASLIVVRPSVAAQNSGSVGGGAAADEAFPAGTLIDSSLSSALDAKKNKAGDRVEVHVTQDIKQNGKVLLKKGTRLTGHITEAQARTKDQTQSDLGIVFDRAIPKNGEEIPIGLTIQALAAPQVSPAQYNDDGFGSGALSSSSSAAESGGGVLGGGPTLGSGSSTDAPSNASSGGNVPTVSGARSAGAVGGLTPSGRLAPNSSGVFGLEGLTLRTLSASSASEGSLILSATKNVHLDTGTQVLLVVAGPAQ